METLHHAIMSERWARNLGCDEDVINEIVFWSMMPDLALSTIGYDYRGLTHLEDDPSVLGSQIHHTTSDLSLFLIDSQPLINPRPSASYTAKAGLLLHFSQDRAYDEWIARYVGVARSSDGSWAYYRKDNGSPLSPDDVMYTKRWSWRCAWMEEISNELTEPELAGDLFPNYLYKRYIVRAKQHSRWHPAMELSLIKLWKHEMEQTAPPPAMSDLEEDMRYRLSLSWTAWKDDII